MEEASYSKSVLSGFAYYLAEAKLLDKQVALSALQQAALNKESYIEYLVKRKLIDESQMAKVTSEYFGLPLCDINAFNTDLVSSEYLNIHLVRLRLALPVLQKGGLLYLAITDPTVENLYEARFLTGFDVRLFIVEASKLTQVIDQLLSSLILSEMTISAEDQLDQITINAYKEENVDVAAYDVESAPVVNYVNRVLLDAIEKGASDIHFERYEDAYRIRFRQFGILYPITAPPLKLANYLLARIKVMSNLDITEHRVPQDGRFKLIVSRKRAVDFRVSVCPTLFGEKIVLRILDSTHAFGGIELLGMEQDQQDNLESALRRSQGLILVTGPTGSGKTVTLYSSLNMLNSTEKNISTVEDPVEILLEGVNQVNINLKTGLTFATALRAFLRQDPDIIMVGEIRDLETAEIAVKAAQTGHLVLSTLHTNSAPETLARLVNMGVEPYNLATSLTLVVAQRLLRVLCNYCKRRQQLPEDILLKEGFKKEELANLELYEAGSCEQCLQGYKGRTGIFEVMPISREIADIVMENGNALQISDQANKEGIINLRVSGLKKVRLGVTSLAELNRVFK